MEDYEIKQTMRNSPEYPPEKPEPAVCSMFPQCQDCTYAAHGFVCWDGDGNCLKTRIGKIEEGCQCRR